MLDVIRQIRDSIVKSRHKKSYSQCGEDLIVDFLFTWAGIPKPTYLDIGAHHPVWLNNTYLFYKRGSTGVCIEPDPELCSAIQRKRKRDICLNVGIGVDKKEQADFYIMSSRTLNTFSRDEAENCQNTQRFGRQKIERVIKVRLRDVNAILEEALNGRVNFISLDTEGLDFEIVRTFDFGRFYPEVFCIETLRHQNNGSLGKLHNLIDFMKRNEYRVYADTYINTIFVRENFMATLTCPPKIEPRVP